MSLGEKVADAIPDRCFEYVHEHPRVLYAVTVPLVAFAAYTLVRGIRVHVMVEQFVAAHTADAARAASEALGG